MRCGEACLNNLPLGDNIVYMSETEKPDSKSPIPDERTLIAVVEDGLFDPNRGGRREKIEDTINENIRGEHPGLADFILRQMKEAPSPRVAQIVGETAYVVYQVLETLKEEKKGNRKIFT